MICIRFIADHSIESLLIRLRTIGPASHVEFCTIENGKMTDTFGARLSGGICHRVPDYCKPTWQEIYTFDGIEASYAEALKLDGRKYDWLDIVYLGLGWCPKIYDPAKAICSALVGYSNRMAWANSDVPVLVNPSIPTNDMTPDTIYACVSEMVTL